MSAALGKPCRILLVDDSDHDRAEAKAALLNGSLRRWEILEATYGEEALRLCASDPAIDCVVLDVDLPDATALQILAEMARDDDGLISIPAVILTSSVSVTASQEVLRAGAQDYVGKSWLCPESLTRAVDNAIERHAMTRALRSESTRRQLVAEVAQAAAGGSGQALHLLLEKVRLLVRAKMFLVYVTDSSNPWQLRLQSSAGVGDEELAGIVTIPSAASTPSVSANLQTTDAIPGTVSSCPLMVDGRVYGTLTFGAQEGHRFSAADIEFIALVGRQIGSAWQRLELLRAKEHELRIMTDNSPDILTRHDRDLRCVFVNQAITRVTGRLPAAFIGRSNHEIGMSGQARALWDGAIRHVLDTGEAQTFEMAFTRSDQVRYFECRLMAERGADGERDHVMGISHDITERRQQALRREQLLEAERAARIEGERVALIKDEFLATVTHELRTPLASIISWSSLLKMSLKNEAMVERCIDVIVGSASEQAALIADLLDMNRIVSGKMRMESDLVDVDQVASNAADTLSLTVAAKGLSLGLTLDCGPEVRIRGDAGRLRQVLWNLLTNAVKFTPSGGSITLATAVVGNEVTIRVSDNGSGIDPAYLPFLFDRFTQADGSRARLHGGLGLGLSIVKNLVESHGGTVVGSSAGPDQGASFLLRFPLVGPDAPGPLLQPEAPDSLTLAMQDAARTGVLKGVSILLVDDVGNTLAFMQRLLVEVGANVRVAESAQQALEQMALAMPDVLLSDIGMPGTDGYQLLEMIRREMGLGAECLPAAAVTAYTRPQDHARALQAGYQACIQKPVDETLLIRTVLALLEMKTLS